MSTRWPIRAEVRLGRMRTVSAVFVVAIVYFACGSAGVEGEWKVQVDTLPNGAVRVVHVPPADPAPTWVIEEELRIGTVDEPGPMSFGWLRGLVVTADGRIVVLDAQAKELRVFGPGGKHLATYGREGGGPGEFLGPNGLKMGPDGRLWVPDPDNLRMSIFDVDAGFVTSHPYTPWS